MSAKATRTQLFQWLANAFQEDAAAINEARTRQSFTNWDSMGTLLLIAELDENLHVTFEEEELKGIGAVGDIITLLRQKGIEITDA